MSARFAGSHCCSTENEVSDLAELLTRQIFALIRNSGIGNTWKTQGEHCIAAKWDTPKIRIYCLLEYTCMQTLMVHDHDIQIWGCMIDDAGAENIAAALVDNKITVFLDLSGYAFFWLVSTNCSLLLLSPPQTWQTIKLAMPGQLASPKCSWTTTLWRIYLSRVGQ